MKSAIFPQTKDHGTRDTSSSSNVFDVAVLGGGPAGMSTALALARRGVSVVAIERSNYEYQRFGETLPPGVKKLLTHLGVWERFLREEPAPSFDIRAAWGAADLRANDFIFSPYGCGWHVNRLRFDAMVAEAARDAGTHVLLGTQALSCKAYHDRLWRIDVSSAETCSSIQATYLVDATGRPSLLRRTTGSRKITYDRLVGIVGFFSPPSRPCHCGHATLIEAVRHGWWYLAPLPDERVVVAFMSDGDLFSKGCKRISNYWTQQLRATRYIHPRLKFHVRDSDLSVRIAYTSRLDPMAGENWLAVGEAAMTFDPLSGQGVYKALESGLQASQSIATALAGNDTALREYARKTEEAFETYLRSRQLFYLREQRWPNNPFWKRRITGQAIQSRYRD